MLLVAFLTQPVFVLYTRMAMRHAAAEGVRVLATTRRQEDVRAFVLRRLGAVPEAAPFHVGGPSDWTVDLFLSDDGRRATVEVSGHLRPLPLLGVGASLLGEADAVGVLLREEASVAMRPGWLAGGYQDWMRGWEGEVNGN